MRHVAAADGKAVAVAADGDHGQGIIGGLDAGGNRQGASMQAVKTVGVDEEGESRRTTDARDHNRILGRDAQFVERPRQAIDDAEVAAARAPGRH